MDTGVDLIELQNRRVEEHLQEAIHRMELWTNEQLQKLRMTEPSRRVAERVYRKLCRSRHYLILPRHSERERRFLRMMLKLAIATDPSLQQRAVELAKYLSGSYPFEWTVSAVTNIARAIARDVILREADSTFGDTPMAAELAFVLFHHEQLGVENVSDYAETYSRALTLYNANYFEPQDRQGRLDLGLQRHSQLRGLALRAE